tara:strand:+ start:927 stop:1916 length:990 start_codon:yes stop_codon:yes gene_type:complete
LHLFNNIESEIISSIRKSEKNLKIAVTWFTNQEIFIEILKKLENPEFEVHLIVLNDRINNKKEGLDFQKLIESKGNFYFSNSDNMVHHKICIIDNSTLITGSYNWTYYAENRNWENVVFIQNREIIEGYINEFDRIIENHKKVKNIELVAQKVAETSNEYLNIDYTLQAENESRKGNDLTVAKIYTELIRINTKKEEKEKILKARNKITNKYNDKFYEVSPFEIGILYKNGYSLAIPAFEKLPFTVVKGGKTSEDNATSLSVTIQKNDYNIPKTILEFSFEELKAQPKGTKKIEHTLTLEKDGILTIFCKELNGFGRTKTIKLDIKNCL